MCSFFKYLKYERDIILHRCSKTNKNKNIISSPFHSFLSADDQMSYTVSFTLQISTLDSVPATFNDTIANVVVNFTASFLTIDASRVTATGAASLGLRRYIINGSTALSVTAFKFSSSSYFIAVARLQDPAFLQQMNLALSVFKVTGVLSQQSLDVVVPTIAGAITTTGGKCRSCLSSIYFPANFALLFYYSCSTTFLYQPQIYDTGLIHKCILAYMHTYMYTYIYTYIHTYTCIHTYTYICIYIHIHLHIIHTYTCIFFVQNRRLQRLPRSVAVYLPDNLPPPS